MAFSSKLRKLGLVCNLRSNGWSWVTGHVALALYSQETGGSFMLWIPKYRNYIYTYRFITLTSQTQQHQKWPPMTHVLFNIQIRKETRCCLLNSFSSWNISVLPFCLLKRTAKCSQSKWLIPGIRTQSTRNISARAASEMASWIQRISPWSIELSPRQTWLGNGIGNSMDVCLFKNLGVLYF